MRLESRWPVGAGLVSGSPSMDSVARAEAALSMSAAERVTFRINHRRASKKDAPKWGAFSATEVDKKASFDVKATWPMDSDKLFPGTVFSAVLQETSFRGRQQQNATEIRAEKHRGFTVVQHMMRKTPDSKETEQQNYWRMMFLFNKFGDGLYDVLLSVYEQRKSATALGLYGCNTGWRYAQAFAKRKPYIDFALEFPSIPAAVISELGDITADDLRRNPFRISRMKVRGHNMLQVADDIFMQLGSDRDREAVGVERLGAYAARACDDLSEQHGGFWWKCDEIV
eukprot:1941885-Prymnesium_polylepis.1